MDSIRVAAIQMRAKAGAVAANLTYVESVVREAFRRGAEWVILPEFFTSTGAFGPSMLSAWLPLEGPALELLRKLAREHNGVVGGSFLAKSGRDCFNSFLLVFPDGQYYRHDKNGRPCGRTAITSAVRMTAFSRLQPVPWARPCAGK